jgi:glycerate kinase
LRIVVAPDRYGGSLSAPAVAAAIADGWRRTRPDDEVVEVPLSDGGEGLLEVVARPDDESVEVEVAGPLGHPVTARWLRRRDGSAVVESALACGLHLVPGERRSPMLTTTYGVGELLDHVAAAGVRRVLVGLGGSATVDAGTGALAGLGFRLRVADGSGLRIGGDDLHRLAAIERGWARVPDDLDVRLLADVATVLADAPRVFGPQKGATDQDVEALEAAVATVVEVVGRDLAPPADPDGRQLHEVPGSGAAGGLGYGLAAALGARFVPGAVAVGDLVGLPAALRGADLVVTGEGRLDATSTQGKVVGYLTDLAAQHGIAVAAVVGQDASGGGGPSGRLTVVQASPQGPGAAPAADVAAAAAHLAERWPAG